MNDDSIFPEAKEIGFGGGREFLKTFKAFIGSFQPGDNDFRELRHLLKETLE